MTPLLRSDGGVTLIGGGVVTAQDMAQARAIAPVLAAADGGGDMALALGAIPDAVIGDLDSLSDAGRAAIPADRLHLIPEQDSTDFTKCLTRIDAPFVIAIGFEGRRLDHTLAALNSMARYQGDAPPVFMLAGDDVVFLAPPVLELPVVAGTRVSLFPLGPCRAQSTGLEWPVDGLALHPVGQTSTSNRATGPVNLRSEGPLLVMLPRDCLRLALTALGLG